MRLFRSAVLIILLGVAACHTTSGPQVGPQAWSYDVGHGGRHG
jgi:hypothetical protein